MTDEDLPPPAGAEPEPELAAEPAEDSSSEKLVLEEPLDAVRLSPYAICALVLGLFALSTASQMSFVWLSGFEWRNVVLAAPVAVGGILGLWLAGRAEEEIYAANGRFGGVGFCQAGRMSSIAALAFAGLPIVVPILRLLGININV